MAYMKIIMGLDGDRVARDARDQLVAQARERRESGYVNPLDVPVHAARYPYSCSDCGDTYWTSEVWTPHRKCRKSRKVGFTDES